MKLYPNGRNEKEKTFIGLFVCPESPMKSDLQFIITFTLIDEKSGKQLYTQQFAKSAFDASSSIGLGVSGLPQDQFLTVENLVVHCKLEYKVEKLIPSFGKHSDLATDISRSFSTSINNGDVTFVVGEKEFQAHKFILAARSPVFVAMFQHDMKEIALNRVNIVDIEPDIFQALLRFIYTDQVDLTIETSKDLLAAANRYFLDLLKATCESFLIKELTAENCSEMLVQAHTLDALNLKKAAVNFIRKSPAVVIETSGWKELKKSFPELSTEVLEMILLSA